MARRVFVILLMLGLLLGACASGVDLTKDKKTSSKETRKDGDTSDTEESPEPDETATSDGADLDAVFVPLAGYEWVKTPDLEADFRKDMMSDEESQKYVSNWAVRSATRNGESVALVMAFKIKPDYAALPGVEQEIVKGVTEGSETRPQTFTLAGERVTYVEDVEGEEFKGIIWLQGGLVFLVMGTDRAGLEAVAAGLIKGNE